MSEAKAADEIWKLSCDQTLYHEAFSDNCNFAKYMT